MKISEFLSTLSLRRATDTPVSVFCKTRISIHALLAESDRYRDAEQVTFWQFLSTLSLRRATSDNPETHRPCAISIHALLAESDLRHCTTYLNCSRFLSTLSLRRATLPICKYGLPLIFLSTLSLRRATTTLPVLFWKSIISIHALLAESDRRHRGNDRCPVHFYPRSPCGERPFIMTITICIALFLSTLSLRRATINPTS